MEGKCKSVLSGWDQEPLHMHKIGESKIITEGSAWQKFAILTWVWMVRNWMVPGNNRVSAISTEIFKYVRIHPNFASRPVWCEKMFLCCFPPKTTERRLAKQGQKSTPTPLPSPSVHPNDVKRILAIFCCVAQGVHISCIQIHHFFRRKGAIGGLGVGGGGGMWERTLGLFVKSFLPAFKEKTT